MQQFCITCAFIVQDPTLWTIIIFSAAEEEEEEMV